MVNEELLNETLQKIKKEGTFDSVKAKADNGDVESQFIVGKYLFEIDKSDDSEQKAIKYMIIASDNDSIDAQMFLGEYYDMNGDDVASANYYKMAADLGDIEGMKQYSHCLLYRLNPRDEEGALRYMKKAADLGDGEAAFFTALQYRWYDDKDNIDEYFRYLTISSNNGDSKGHLYLGKCYYEGIGTSKDYAKAFECFKKGEELNNDDCVLNLGLMYFNGHGVKQDYDKAYFYFRESGYLGNREAIYYEGLCYLKGLGTDQCDELAFKHFQRSSQLNIAPAFFELGNCYLNAIGTEVNLHRAIKYYKAGAHQNNVHCIKALAKCYREGIGVEQDEQTARQYEELLEHIKDN